MGPEGRRGRTGEPGPRGASVKGERGATGSPGLGGLNGKNIVRRHLKLLHCLSMNLNPHLTMFQARMVYQEHRDFQV